MADDREFAVRLFGADRWPADMDAGRLRALDARSVSVGLTMPKWSIEFDDSDWMPNLPLPIEILEAGGGAAREALEAYYAAPTVETLRAAVLALRVAQEEDGPCVGGPTGVDPVGCFEARRWVAGLIAVHFLRYGTPDPVDRVFADAWWDVGDLTRRIDDLTPRGPEIAPGWLYLGWSFDTAAERVLTYMIGGMEKKDRARLATFVMMRTMVHRPGDSATPYRDLLRAVKASPPHWSADVLHSGLNILLEQVDSGIAPRSAPALEAVETIAEAFDVAERKAPGETVALEPLRQQLLVRLRLATANRLDRAAERRGRNRRSDPLVAP